MPLKAIVDNRETLANDFSSGKEIKCPHCKTQMIFINPLADIIKHFRHKVSCPYSTEPESREHIEMKGFFMKNIPGARVEVKIRNRIADIIVGDVVIECQVSSISFRDLKQRTEDYNKNGFWVMWILHWKNYADEIKQTKIIERFLQTNNFGRFYIFDGDNTIKPIHYKYISPCEFCDVIKYRICEGKNCWYFNKERGRPYSTSTRYRGYRNSNTGKIIKDFSISRNKNGFASFINDGGAFWRYSDD